MKLDWRRLLNLEETQILWLDIGSSAVRIVQLRKDNAGYVVTAAGIAGIAKRNGTHFQQTNKLEGIAIKQAIKIGGNQNV